MQRFWGLFDGSKFYSLRAKYRKELFDKASAIVLKADIVIDLETSDRVIPLSPSDRHTIATAKDWLKTLEKHYLAGTLGELWTAGEQIYLHRKGLRYFTDTLAEHKARFESNYAMDLVSGAQIASWVAEFVIGIALNALTGLPVWAAVLTSALGTITTMLLQIQSIGNTAAEQSLTYITYTQSVQVTGLPVWAAVLTSALGTITTMLLQIQSIGNTAAEQSLTYITYTQSVQAHQAQSRLQTLGGRKALQEGALEIYQGYSNYANGFRYKNYSAGSETYQPSQPYTPSHLQTKPQESQQDQNLKQLDEQTQGRAHYDLAGNEGFMQKISPHTPLAQAKEPENDLAYRQNTLNNNSQDLRKVLSELAIYLGSTEQYSSSDYLQAVYDFNFNLKEEQFHTYAQSRDFLAQNRRYNHALRASELAYSKHLAKKAAHKDSQALENPYSSLHPQTPSDQNPTPQPPSKIQENIIKLELESSLKAQGLDDEQVSQLVWGSEQESEQQQAAREQAYKQAKIKHLKALDSTKATKAIKAYDLLINYATYIAMNDRTYKKNIATKLQNLYTQGYNEFLAHQVLAEQGATLHASDFNTREVWQQMKESLCGSDVFVYKNGEMKREHLACNAGFWSDIGKFWCEHHIRHTPKLPRPSSHECARYFYHQATLPYAKAQELALSWHEILRWQSGGDSDPYQTLELGNLDHERLGGDTPPYGIRFNPNLDKDLKSYLQDAPIGEFFSSALAQEIKKLER